MKVVFSRLNFFVNSKKAQLVTPDLCMILYDFLLVMVFRFTSSRFLTLTRNFSILSSEEGSYLTEVSLYL